MKISIRKLLLSRVDVLVTGILFLVYAIFILIVKSEVWLGEDLPSEIQLKKAAIAVDEKLCPCGSHIRQSSYNTSPEGDNLQNAGVIKQTNVMQPQNGRIITEALAYRLILNGETCRLDEIDETRGDFKQIRAFLWEPGMICCRLLDASGRQLAVETMPAPDRVCVVLDPRTLDENGNHTVVKFNPGGEKMFQTRMPKIEGAAKLQIIRLDGGEPTSPEQAPAGQIISTIDLP